MTQNCSLISNHIYFSHLLFLISFAIRLNNVYAYTIHSPYGDFISEYHLRGIFSNMLNIETTNKLSSLLRLAVIAISECEYFLIKFMQITIRIETIMPLVLVTRLMKIIFNYLKYHLTSSLWCIFLLWRLFADEHHHKLPFYLSIPHFAFLSLSRPSSIPSFACVLHVPCVTRGKDGKIEINFSETLFRALSLKSKRLGYKVLPTHPQHLCSILSLFSHISFLSFRSLVFFCVFGARASFLSSSSSSVA